MQMCSTMFVALIFLCFDGSSASLRGSAPARSLDTFTPDKTKAAAAFWNAVEDTSAGATVVKARITDNWSSIASAVTEAGIADAKEFAMFIANIMQETGEMTTKTEAASHYTSSSYDWGECKAGVSVPVKGSDLETSDECTKHYFGRGYLQTTWHKNYKAIKDAGKCKTDSAGNSVDIVANPEKVASDEKLAWCTAAYYWKTAVHDDRCKDGCDMGNTISAINGALECGTDGNAEAQRRFCFFKDFYESYADTTLYWSDNVCITDLDALCPVR
jgi:predicted chitinase